MKAEIILYKIKRGEWKIYLAIGHQHFQLAYKGNKEQVTWMKKTLKEALIKLSLSAQSEDK